MRKKIELYPDYLAYIEHIDKNGIDSDILQKIIEKHRCNRKYNKDLYERYQAVSDKVPIFERKPRFDEKEPINNKINNDFFGEIIDFKVGYFAGKPISYSYSKTDESEYVTEAEPQFFLRGRQRPEIRERIQMSAQADSLLPFGQDDELRILPPVRIDSGQRLLRVRSPQVGQDHISPCGERRLRLAALRETIAELLHGRHRLEQLEQLGLFSDKEELNMAMIHEKSPPMQYNEMNPYTLLILPITCFCVNVFMSGSTARTA